MKRYLPLLFAVILFSCASSQRTIFLKTPTADQRDSIDVEAYETRYGKYDGVYLDIDESIEHSGMSARGMFGTSWDYHYVIHRKYLVLNPDAQDLTTFTLRTYRHANIGTLYLRVTSPDGSVKQYGIKDLVKETVSEYVVSYKFIFPAIVKGSLIEEGFEMGYNGLRNWPSLQEDIPLQFSIPCERVAFTFAYPDWWEIRMKRISPTDTIPYKFTHDPESRKNVFSCVAHNVRAVKDEPYDPYFKEMAAYMEFMVSSFEMGDLHYAAPKDWTELISRYRTGLTDREGRGLFSSRVENVTEDLVKGKTDQLEKLTTILDYVQTNIEAANDSKNRDFADVLKDKKGDSYEVTGLTNMMLKKAGLETDFVMVHSAKEGYFDSSYYSFDQLSIPAIEARVGGTEYVLLPYRKDIPYDYVPEYLQGQRCVVVSDAAQAMFTTIPSGSPTRNSVSEGYKLVIGADGLINVEETKTIQGSYAYFLREYLSDLKETEKDKFIKELITYSEGKVNITSHVLENEKEYKKPLVLRYTYTIDNLVTLTPDEVLFHTAGLFAPTSLKAFRVESEERTSPIRIYNDEEYVKEIEVRYPDTWELKTPLHPLEIENMFGTLKVDVTNSGHLLKVHQRRFLKRNSQLKDRIVELAKLTGSKTSTVLPTVVFGKNP